VPLRLLCALLRMTLRTLMQQALERQEQRAKTRVVGLVSLRRAPPTLVDVPVRTFYEHVCRRLGVRTQHEVYVFLLDQKSMLWLLCRRALRGRANWVASALARTVVRGPALVFRSYSLIPARILDFSGHDYSRLEGKYQRSLGTARVKKKRGGPLALMIVRERRRAQRALAAQAYAANRVSLESSASSSLHSYSDETSASE